MGTARMRSSMAPGPGTSVRPSATHQVPYADRVAAAECLAVVVPVGWRNIGMAVFVAIVHVGAAMIVVVPARALNAVMESAPLDLVELAWRRIPCHRRGRGRRRRRRSNRPAHQVRHRAIVAAAKSVPVHFTLFRRKIWVAVFIAIIHVGLAMIIEVSSCSFNSVAKAAALNLIQFLGRDVPSTVIILSVSGRFWGRRRGMDAKRKSRAEEKCQRWKGILFEMHRSISFPADHANRDQRHRYSRSAGRLYGRTRGNRGCAWHAAEFAGAPRHEYPRPGLRVFG